jgi:hypothetical protein
MGARSERPIVGAANGEQMTKHQHRAREKATAPTGAWLAFLALAIQVLLPFFIANDVALASTQTDPDYTIVICSAFGAAKVPAQQEGSHHRHGLLSGCPICTALTAGQAYTPGAPLTLPLPQTEAVVFLRVAYAPRAPSIATASYNSRAPPFIG